MMAPGRMTAWSSMTDGAVLESKDGGGIDLGGGADGEARGPKRVQPLGRRQREGLAGPAGEVVGMQRSRACDVPGGARA